MKRYAEKMLGKSTLFKNSKQRLYQQYGEIKGLKIYSTALDKLEQMLVEHSNDDRYLKIHTHQSILPGIAIYQSIAELLSKDDAMSFVYEEMRTSSVQFNKKIKTIFKFPGIYKLFPKLFYKTTMSLFGPKSGFVSSYGKCDKDGMVLNIVKCPYNDTCNKWHCGEFAKVFCDSDDYCYSDMHKRLIWKRTMTLAKGGNCCDFKIIIDNKPKV